MEKETAATDALGFHQSLLLDLYQQARAVLFWFSMDLAVADEGQCIPMMAVLTIGFFHCCKVGSLISLVVNLGLDFLNQI